MPALVSPVLVGRRRELALIAAAWERAAAGAPEVLLVGGEAGVGKTRLVEDGARAAEKAGALVLAGACGELGGEGLPFAPLVDMLRTLARSTPPEELEALLGHAREELARLLPELAPGVVASPTDTGHAARLFELVLGVIGRLAAQRPLLLVVEDLHWADRSTLDLVAFLVRTLRAGPVLLVGTYRSDELHRRHPLRSLLASLERVRTVGRVELAPFTRGEFDEQVEAILGGPVERGLAQKVYERSEGNAFLVEEMLAIVQRGADLDHLPPSLRDVLLARAEQLPAEVQHVVRVAAVAGRRVPERLLATVAGVPEPALFDALREAVERHVLVVEEAGYAFRHALVRQAIYDEVLPGERAALHAAYGEAVEATPSLAGDEASAAAALAYHWDAARDLPRALAAAVQAAGHAIAAYAPADAERHVARALEMWPQVPDAEQRAGMDRLAVAELGVAAAVSAGHEERAIALVDEALAAIDREAEGARAALLLERRAEALRWSGRGTGMEELEAALSLLPGEPPTPELAVVLASLANAHLLIGQMADAEAIAERAIAAARAAGAPREEASALVTSGSALAYRGDPDAGLAALEAGLRVATAAGDHLTALRASSNLSDLLELMGRHEDAIAAASDGLALAERVGLSRYRFGPFLVANLAEPLMRLGRWTEADAVLAAATETQGLNDRTHALYVARGLIAIGRGEDGARHLALVRQVAGNELDIQQRLDAVRLEAEVAHAEGRLEPARAVLAGALADPGARGLPRFAWPLVALALRVEADVATRARDLRTPPSADALAGLEALAAALRRTAPADHGHAALAAAELARARGEDAVEAWAAAVAAWRAAGEPHPLAYALLRLAEAGLAGGDREAAATAVREAAEIAERLGARPLADAAAALIRRARLEPAAAPAAGPAGDEERLGLTEREREVLRLIAEGRTNAQIAAELFISPKTASVHVSNILRKLDVASRGEAAAMAHRLGLV